MAAFFVLFGGWFGSSTRYVSFAIPGGVNLRAKPVFISIGCNSSLSASIPVENWRASSEEGQMKFGAYNARMNSAAGSGWCASYSKGNKRAFIQVSVVHHMLGRPKMHFNMFPPQAGKDRGS